MEVSAMPSPATPRPASWRPENVGGWNSGEIGFGEQNQRTNHKFFGIQLFLARLLVFDRFWLNGSENQFFRQCVSWSSSNPCFEQDLPLHILEQASLINAGAQYFPTYSPRSLATWPCRRLCLWCGTCPLVRHSGTWNSAHHCFM